jgi:hypothetical protein
MKDRTENTHQYVTRVFELINRQSDIDEQHDRILATVYADRGGRATRYSDRINMALDELERRYSQERHDVDRLIFRALDGLGKVLYETHSDDKKETNDHLP